MSDASHDEPVIGSDPVVRCESCGNQVHLSATEEITRLYHGRSFTERWCLLCTAAVKEATETAKSYNDNTEPEY